MKDRLMHIRLLSRCVDISRRSREAGNTPFGCLLAGADGTVLWEQDNCEITESVCTGHAETRLMEAASNRWSKEFLWMCTLYTTVEPCAMCSGAIYWGHVGTVVYGVSEKRLAELTGDHLQNPTLDLPCREVFARGRKPIVVEGPFPELEEEVISVHKGYWS
ncbi:nucleoside deaminase [Paenibacillus chartarius]|uniref:Nucleoside deaminase n=1 Tax=Paenibacillus chartarius TaxID=747481 RepID=A0ABV6DH49_9BACL